MIMGWITNVGTAASEYAPPVARLSRLPLMGYGCWLAGMVIGAVSWITFS